MSRDRSANHSDLLDRTKELEFAADFIGSVRSGRANYFCINFYAPRGFGKTCLLQKILQSQASHLPVAYVDVNTAKTDSGFSPEAFLLQIAAGLRANSPDTGGLPSRDASQENLARSLLDLAQNMNPLALVLIDNYDDLPYAFSRWFEDRVVSALLAIGRAAFMLTSDLVVRFTEQINLRMRLEHYGLSGLSSQDISTALTQNQSLAGEVWELSGGIPAIAIPLIEQLNESGLLSDCQLIKALRDCHPTLVREALLSGFDPGEVQAIRLLALLRRFDQKFLGNLLSQMLPDHYLGCTGIEIHMLLGRLGGFVEWQPRSDPSSYMFNGALQMALRKYVHIQDPPQYKSIHSAEADIYQRLFKQQYARHYLVECLYHTSVLLANEPRDTVIKSLQAIIASAPQALLDRAERETLQKILTRDPDLGCLSSAILP